MPWLLAFIAISGLVYLAYSSPEARIAVIFVLVALIGGVGYLLYDEYETDRLAETLIAPDDLQLRDFATSSRTGILYARGNVKNLSEQHTLESLELRVQAHGCPAETLDKSCETIGESVEKISVQIPPGQIRSVVKSVSFSNLPAVENLLWSYEVVSARTLID